MVGSKNVSYSGFNRVTDMKRNIGSLIKPAIVLQALSLPQQYTLASQLKDEPITLLNRHGKRWSPHNFDNNHQGQMSLLEALVKSKNIPTVNLGMALGVDEVIEGLRKLGINSKINSYPSLFLGALELSPMQVSQMYNTLADRGIYKPLSTLSTVTTIDGALIWQRKIKAKANFSMPAVYLTNHALQQVTKQGTARALGQWFPDTQLAGKTGTTDDLRDSWFTGFDNQTLTTVWLGKDDYSPVGLTATQGALPVFAELHRVVKPISIVDIVPDGVEPSYFSNQSGERVAQGCDNVVELPAIKVSDGEVSGC
jgi:penicillin-binding protein 1B